MYLPSTIQKPKNNENNNKHEKHHPPCHTHGNETVKCAKIPYLPSLLAAEPTTEVWLRDAMFKNKVLREKKKTLPEQKCTQTQDP